MTYVFLEGDYRALGEKIVLLSERFREIGQNMGASCEEGAETYHDNFAYEDGERQQRMLSARLREMIRIRNLAQVIRETRKSDRVSVGRVVTVEDEDTGDTRSFRIGSYMVLDDQNAISYRSPLAQILMGARVGDVRVGIIGGRRRRYEVTSIA